MEQVVTKTNKLLRSNRVLSYLSTQNDEAKKDRIRHFLTKFLRNQNKFTIISILN
jgi:hypothetical protein